jgi:hypothetical protein
MAAMPEKPQTSKPGMTPPPRPGQTPPPKPGMTPPRPGPGQPQPAKKK